ncbi:hypothetical protein K466DRAFT_654561 [Polyporus arcularius HHB13444]|uniref:BTB domain-containing protein n=1 Tax=Polyporus arcularius HHB13444 TaxID=1314778 RepID=A0A5C3P585_9APHY|nr:hypothetical protein K466DRAFT_654561 [Polyporus arcularius HHB13444]
MSEQRQLNKLLAVREPEQDVAPLPSTSGLRAASDEPTDARAEADHQDLDDEEQDAEFWFADGDVILVARGVSFQVYREPLAIHSAVFRDMLSVPQPQGPQHGTRPRIPLDDFPGDLRHLLRVLMSGEDIMNSNPITCSALSAWIRLGDKYGMNDLMIHSIYLLHLLFPHPIYYEMPPDDDSPLESVRPSFAIAAVNLARLTGNTTTVLPMALLDCAALGPDVMQGYRREDGTYDHLSQEDLKRCLRAREMLVEGRLQVFNAIFNSTVFWSWRSPQNHMYDCEREADAEEQDVAPAAGHAPGPMQPV